MSESNLLFEPEGRFLSLRGSYINEIGSQIDPHVQPEHVENRLLRDGKENGHHITVINHLEIGSLIPSENKGEEQSEKTISKGQQKKAFKQTQKDICDRIINQFGLASEWQRPIDLGIGRCVDDQAIAYYRVIHWPFGQMIRKVIGLPRSNFHVTVGFIPRDVHLYKGPASLICLQRDEYCSREQLQKLIKVAEYYIDDKAFIKLLFRISWQHKYFWEIGSLTKLCMACKCVTIHYT
ncbi:MAG: hypothetical protein EXX96DRAFT_647353 [Benjaminiella poitrasii]|nr:MAG: hypothetical protein EXX96DRAFT_647353 [Benjaminiella poitrasii]